MLTTFHQIVATIGKPSDAVWRAHFADLPKSSKLVAAIDSRLKCVPFSACDAALVLTTGRPRPLDKILGKFSPNCVDLISKMVCYDPDARITGSSPALHHRAAARMLTMAPAAEALKHPYFQEDPQPAPYHPKIVD